MNYGMGGTILSKTVMEKGLGVTMNANMKVSEQCRIAASKGNQVLGMIRRNITYKEKSLTVCDDVDNGLDNTCEVIRQETVLFSTPETDYIIYD